MKRILIILLTTVIILLTSCVNLEEYVPIDEYYNKLVELDEANSEIESKSLEIVGLKEKVNTLENDLADLELGLELSNEEIEKYKYLLSNLNELLGNVYYGYGENSEYFGEFTAFSIEYGERYYILTAGHCVEMNEIKYDRFKFKSTFDNDWIYPELLTYQNNSINRNDYAIFYNNKIKDGLIIDDDNDLPKYILGNNKSSINIIRSFYDKTFDGESGSAIIDYEGEIIGINTTDIHSYFTKIDTVLKAIDVLD